MQREGDQQQHADIEVGQRKSGEREQPANDVGRTVAAHRGPSAERHAHGNAGRERNRNQEQMLAGQAQEIRAEQGAGSFDLTLALSQVETNIALGTEVFKVDVPRTAQPITLEELRHARPGVRQN